MHSSRQSNKTAHRGFTIVELLMVITIIGIMSSMALVVMKNAQEEARESATRSRIQQIESLMQLQIEDFEVRRLPIRTNVLALYVAANPIGGVDSRVQLRNLRRRIMADIINAEMPRPFLDASNFFINNPDLGFFPTRQAPINASAPYDDGFYDWLENNYSTPLGGMTLAERLDDVRPAGVNSFLRYNGDPTFNLPGEYLYAILLRIDVDGVAATEQLGNSFFGDSDGDGHLEVVDAWGEPMSLQIWQVTGVEVDATGAPQTGTDIWQDDLSAGQNYDLFATYTLNNEDVRLRDPIGYELMNPAKSREITKFRFEVTSFALNNRTR